jgi:polyferredoxin
MTEVHEHASICPACGAQRGVRGRSVESWRQTSNFLLGFAAVLFVLGVVLGTWIASDYSTTWFDGLIGFLLLSPFMLLFAGLGLVMRYVIPRMQESWYR